MQSMAKKLQVTSDSTHLHAKIMGKQTPGADAAYVSQDAARAKYGYRPKEREGAGRAVSRSPSGSRGLSRRHRHSSRRSSSIDRGSDRLDGRSERADR